MSDFYKLILVVFNFYLISLKVFGNFQYPIVRRNDSIKNDFWGTIVVDAYRWLEDGESEETKRFVDQQNEQTLKYIARNQYRDDIIKTFKKFYDYPRYGIPVKHGSKYYFWHNSGLQEKSILYSADTPQSESHTSGAQVFLDPNTLSTDGTVSVTFVSFSLDGKFCAYGVSERGSDWMSIKIRDVETGDDLPEQLYRIKWSSSSWTHDNRGFFYSYFDQYNGTAKGSDTKTPDNQKLFYHRLNTSQESDIMIIAFPLRPRSLIRARVSDDGKYVHVWPRYGWPPTKPRYFSPLDSNPITSASSLNFSAVAVPEKDYYYYVTSNDTICYVITKRNAPKYRMVKIDLLNPEETNWVSILPEKSDAVLDMAVPVNQSYLAVVYMRDVSHTIQMHSLCDGKHLWNIDKPNGTVDAIYATRNGSEMFIKISSFLSPGIIYRYDSNSNSSQMKLFRESRIACLNRTQFETKQVFFRSKDRTVSVPMFIVHKKNIKLDATNPTMLYAYGGFGVKIMPHYDPSVYFFINNLNGVYAVANVRGGGEYGKSWHESGILNKKQNGFDDFISAAEYLIRNNYTQRDRLAISGGSNGGLLVAAVSNQRPDLFGCTLAYVGVMDMLRYHLFTMGYSWINEYGNPGNRSHFQYLYKYSPLHNVPANASQYPATLLITADHDDRVVPAHSYKFIAELQYRLGSKLPNTPLLIRIVKNSGHRSRNTLTKQIEQNADTFAFLINSLKIVYNGENEKK